MSTGPGYVERIILALIDANPDGAWTTADLCRQVYPDVHTVTKTQRFTALRSLRSMMLPGTWRLKRLSRAGTACCLFDACSDESQARVKWMESGGGLSFADWRAAYPRMVDKAREAATAARKYRDATPVGTLDIANANAQRALAMMTMAGGEIDRGLAERVAAMQAARAKLAPNTA